MPTIATRFCIALIALACSAAALAQESFSTLEERMTGKEFRDAGLHKLSDEELAALNRWIRMRSLAEGEAPEFTRESGGSTAGMDRRGLPNEAEDRSSIHSRLKGTFEGWDGDTVFELENGMVWQQAENGSHYVSPMESPEVEIRPGLFGTWQLIVEGQNRRLKVERVE